MTTKLLELWITKKIGKTQRKIIKVLRIKKIIEYNVRKRFSTLVH